MHYTVWSFLSVLILPSNPASGHYSPDLAFSTAQVAEPETLHLDLLALAALFPCANLLLGSVPVDDHADVVGLAYFGAVLLMHRPAMALEARVAEAHDISGADLVKLLHGGVGQVGVH